MAWLRTLRKRNNDEDEARDKLLTPTTIEKDDEEGVKTYYCVTCGSRHKEWPDGRYEYGPSCMYRRLQETNQRLNSIVDAMNRQNSVVRDMRDLLKQHPLFQPPPKKKEGESDPE